MEEKISNEPLNKETDMNDLLVSGQDPTVKENERFTKHTPIVTLLIFAIGPASLLVSAIGEIFDMFMISKRFNNDPNSHAVEIIGFANIIVQMIQYVGSFFGQAITARVTTLIGGQQRETAAHLVVDIFRIAFIASIVFPIVFSFCIRPFLRFVGCPDFMLEKTYYFIVPLLVASPLINLFNCTISFMQSIGRSIFSAGLKVLAYVFQCGIFTPLLLFAFRIPTSLIKCSMAFAQSILAVVMLVLIFRGKFSLVPDLKMLIGRFCKQTPRALLLATPMVFQFICFALPPTLILQTLTTVAPQYSKEIGGVFAVFNKITVLTTSIPGSISQALLICGNHAYGANNMKRLVTLMLWSFGISFSLCFIFTPIMVSHPGAIASLFLDNKEEIRLSEMLLPIPFYTISLQGLSYVCSVIYLIVGKPILSLIPSVVQVLIQSFGCKILAKIYSTDMLKIMYIYNITDILIFILNLLLMIYPILHIRKKRKEAIENTFISVESGIEPPYDMIE